MLLFWKRLCAALISADRTVQLSHPSRSNLHLRDGRWPQSDSRYCSDVIGAPPESVFRNVLRAHGAKCQILLRICITEGRLTWSTSTRTRYTRPVLTRLTSESNRTLPTALRLALPLCTPCFRTKTHTTWKSMRSLRRATGSSEVCPRVCREIGSSPGAPSTWVQMRGIKMEQGTRSTLNSRSS
jgi:hypothetical protein